MLRPGCAPRGRDRVPGAGCWAGWWRRCSVLVPASDSAVRCGGAVFWLRRLRAFLFQPVACQQVVGFCLAIWVYAGVIYIIQFHLLLLSSLQLSKPATSQAHTTCLCHASLMSLSSIPSACHHIVYCTSHSTVPTTNCRTNMVAQTCPWFSATRIL